MLIESLTITERNSPQYVMAMGKNSKYTEEKKQPDHYLEEILRNTEKSLEKIAKIEEYVQQPPWYSGFIGYLLAVGIGVGSLFGVDMYRRYRTAKAYNKAGEDYFRNEQLRLSILSFESALAVDPGNLRSRYNLVETLIKLEDDIIQNSVTNRPEVIEASNVSNRLVLEINMLKFFNKEDFVPVMLEAYWLHIQGKRAQKPGIKTELYRGSQKMYLDAIKLYKDSDLYYYKEVSAKLFGCSDKKLNHLYKGIGTLEKDIGNYDAAIKYLVRALRFDKNETETLTLLKECIEKNSQHNA